jgi:hypothetical protein
MIAFERPFLPRWFLAGGLLLLGITGCRDELTTPADCPALCPGGQPQVKDSVLTAIAGDTAFVGYVAAGLGPSLRISNGLPVSEDRAIAMFLPRADSLTVDGEPRLVEKLDSATIALTLQARDTLVTGLKLFVYRLPTGVDTTTTFAEVEPQMVPANLIDSIVVDDSVKSGLLRFTISGADTIRVNPSDTSGRLAIGVTMSANAPSGIRIASIAATGAPNISYHVRVEIADTTKEKLTYTRFPEFTSFVSQSPPPFDLDLLSVGGAPSARSLLRFALPLDIRDSVTILRATLELTPDAPILGLPTDPALLQAFGVLGDLGAKSPIITSGSTIGVLELASGASDTVRIDVTRLVRLWQTDTGLPQLIFLALAPEAASFTQPIFRSTRSGAGAPRIRLTYYQKFPFEVP